MAPRKAFLYARAGVALLLLVLIVAIVFTMMSFEKISLLGGDTTEKNTKACSNSVSSIVQWRPLKMTAEDYVKHCLTQPGYLLDIKQLLEDVTAVLRAANVTFWVHGETLLGIARFIAPNPWDDGVDIGVLKQDMAEKKLIVEKMLRKRGYWLENFDKKGRRKQVFFLIVEGDVDRPHLDLIEFEPSQNETFIISKNDEAVSAQKANEKKVSRVLGSTIFRGNVASPSNLGEVRMLGLSYPVPIDISRYSDALLGRNRIFSIHFRKTHNLESEPLSCRQRTGMPLFSEIRIQPHIIDKLLYHLRMVYGSNIFNASAAPVALSKLELPEYVPEVYAEKCLTPPSTLLDMKKITEDVAQILDELNVAYWIDSANLMGVIRFGAHLPWDDDVDFGVVYDQLKPVKDQLRDRLWQRGYALLGAQIFFSDVPAGLIYVPSRAHLDLIEFERGKEKGTLVPLNPHFKGMIRSEFPHSCIFSPNDTTYSLASIPRRKMLGRMYPIPADEFRYLASWYGGVGDSLRYIMMFGKNHYGPDMSPFCVFSDRQEHDMRIFPQTIKKLESYLKSVYGDSYNPSAESPLYRFSVR